jgi:(E)-4-hydroxy-3-methyl-but-2-enyl pyrophosphate reductase (IPP and DMAPP forming)
MSLNIEIDSNSGFCYGVIRAVKTAEKYLDKGNLYSLGAIVHNNEELARLCNKGMEIIDINKMQQLNNTTVLIRAHGEPPSTYKIASEREIKLIDCTCPVVLKLQEKIRSIYKTETNCQIVIFGKNGHAEVNGLVGQANGDAIIVDIIDSEYKGLDKINYSRPIHIFSQTTKDPNEYEQICSIIKERQSEFNLNPIIHNTICRRVTQRHSKLKKFAETHSVILFVSGKESSNGKVLYELCKKINKRSYLIQNINEIESSWFNNNDNIGICGATSTPIEQLESVANYLLLLA